MYKSSIVPFHSIRERPKSFFSEIVFVQYISWSNHFAFLEIFGKLFVKCYDVLSLSYGEFWRFGLKTQPASALLLYVVEELDRRLSIFGIVSYKMAGNLFDFFFCVMLILICHDTWHIPKSVIPGPLLTILILRNGFKTIHIVKRRDFHFLSNGKRHDSSKISTFAWPSSSNNEIS